MLVLVLLFLYAWNYSGREWVFVGDLGYLYHPAPFSSAMFPLLCEHVEGKKSDYPDEFVEFGIFSPFVCVGKASWNGSSLLLVFIFRDS